MNKSYHCTTTVSKLKKVFVTLLVGLIALFFIFPLVLIITNSFMSEAEIYENYKTVFKDVVVGDTSDSDIFANLKLIPDEVVLEQYYQVLIQKVEFLFFFWNSIKIVLPIVIGQLIIASLAAYAFAKIEFRFREQLFFVYIITMLMPFQVTLVPNFIIADKLGLIGKLSSVILPGVFSTFGVFLLRQFMVYIPNEYIEAARVDGANHFHIFIKIALPMTKAGLASLTILLFIDNWNMVEQPLIFLNEIKDYPLSITLSQISDMEIGISFAASTLYMAPMLLMFLYGENHLVEGLQASGIKG
ncbi:MAG: carbohydrate ABC transporter permease [Firmicutes bacterium]|nr:carbohydrate ABC transporter permease [Bacillota bacterium]